MKYVMSWTDAVAFRRDFPFIPLHFDLSNPFPKMSWFTGESP
jgi:hypothetical protein